MRSLRSVILLLMIIFFLIVFSAAVRTSIIFSLNICATVIVPTLFPFFILSGMLLDFGLADILTPAWSAFLAGQICGFPLGTRMVCSLYQKNKLSRTQATSLLTCTANASPAYVIITLGSAVLKSIESGVILLICQSITAFLLFLFLVPNKCTSRSKQSVCVRWIDSLIHNTKNAVEQIFFVCAMTVVFGIICDVISIFLPNSILIGLVEILHGGTTFSKNDLIQLATVLGFSGLCIWTQCIYYIRQTDLPIFGMIYGKIYSAVTLPLLVCQFTTISIYYKITALLIIILTNTLTACIIKCKGCEKNNDFFKRDRKMLRILRARYKNSL